MVQIVSKKYSNAGKGDKSRISDKKKFDKNWEKIFGKKNNIKEIWSSDNNKVDEDGGPYYYDMNELNKKTKEKE